jgi:hypothetical protein
MLARSYSNPDVRWKWSLSPKPTRKLVCAENQICAVFPLTPSNSSGINNLAAVAASVALDWPGLRLTRGDLGQLAPRKKLLKSFSSFLEDFLRPSEHFGTEGFSFPLRAAQIELNLLALQRCRRLWPALISNLWILISRF